MSDPVVVLREMVRVRGQVAGCTKCELHKTRTQAVPYRGSVPNPITIVGEAPGPTEDVVGQPFVGRSGELLDKLMRAQLGFDSQSCFVCNIVSCFPGRDEQRKIRAPKPWHKDACDGNLRAQLALADSPLIIVLGTHAFARWRPGVRLAEVHGRPQWWEGRWLFPTFHPSAGLQQVIYQRAIRLDFEKLAKFLDSEYALRDETCVICKTTEIDFADDWGLYWCEEHYPGPNA